MIKDETTKFPFLWFGMGWPMTIDVFTTQDLSILHSKLGIQALQPLPRGQPILIMAVPIAIFKNRLASVSLALLVKKHLK